jgi:hydrogenase maturation protease
MKTLILGLGNEILTDDSIGPRIVSRLSGIINRPDIDFRTLSCGGLEIIEQIEGYDRVIFIDGMRNRDGKPGDVYYFLPSDFRETSNLSNLHDINFLTALNLGKSLDLELPTDLHILGIEIVEDMEFGEELTAALKGKYSEILSEVVTLVKGIIDKPENRHD